MVLKAYLKMTAKNNLLCVLINLSKGLIVLFLFLGRAPKVGSWFKYNLLKKYLVIRKNCPDVF